MEDNALIVQHIYHLMESCNRIYAKRGLPTHPVPSVSEVNDLNRDMLLSFRAYLVQLIKTLDPRFNLSAAGINISKNAKTYIPISRIPLKWPAK